MMFYEDYENLRNQAGLKDSQVAKKAGIPRSTFSDWKSGRSKPKEEKMSRILSALYEARLQSQMENIQSVSQVSSSLDTSPEELTMLNGQEQRIFELMDKHLQSQNSTEELNPEVQEIIDTVKTMDTKEISKLKKLINLLLEDN